VQFLGYVYPARLWLSGFLYFWEVLLPFLFDNNYLVEICRSALPFEHYLFFGALPDSGSCPFLISLPALSL
jgi:hypothetical protein